MLRSRSASRFVLGRSQSESRRALQHRALPPQLHFQARSSSSLQSDLALRFSTTTPCTLSELRGISSHGLPLFVGISHKGSPLTIEKRRTPRFPFIASAELIEQKTEVRIA